MRECIVVDCSFVLSGLFPDEEECLGKLSEWHIYVPIIFHLECANVLNTALKKQRISETEHAEYLHILRNLPITVDTFCGSAESIHSISHLCRHFDLTSYDASYLELALRLGAKMATKDTKLSLACKQNDVSII